MDRRTEFAFHPRCAESGREMHRALAHKFANIFSRVHSQLYNVVNFEFAELAHTQTCSSYPPLLRVVCKTGNVCEFARVCT